MDTAFDDRTSLVTSDAPRRPSWRAVLLGGLIIAAADTVFFSAFWWPRGITPWRIFRGVAAGLVGRQVALSGGAGMTLLGIGLHLFNATAFVVIYTVVARSLPAIIRRPYLYGPLYGLVVFVVMSFVVVPLSRIGRSRLDSVVWVAASVAFHVVVVGIGAAWFARRAWAR